MMQGRDYTLGGGRLGIFVLQDTELRPLFCEDWRCRGGGGSGRWGLDADLLDDFGQIDPVLVLLAGKAPHAPGC